MLDAARLKDRMEAAKISQAELARRVGVSQAAIQKLTSGNAYGSKHLHKIARELGTTADYLMGDTNDPSSAAPMGNVVVIDSETREILRLLERMSPTDKRALVQVARSMAKIPATSGKLHDSRRGYRAESYTPKGKR